MRYLDLSVPKIIRFWARTQLYNAYYTTRFIIPNRTFLKQTKVLRNTKAGRSAFVFANGPSMRLLDPEKVAYLQKTKGFDVFTVNSYINSDFSKIVFPDYHFISDPNYFLLDKLEPAAKERLGKDLVQVQERGVTVFLPAQLYHKLDVKRKYMFYDAENIFSNNINILKPRGYVSMTAYKALAAACYMGYSKIYICGMDNDYILTLHVNEKNELFYRENHFYEPGITKLHKILPQNGRNVGELLYFHHYLFKHMEKFARFPIVNLNREGLVDSFQKEHSLDVYQR